MLLTLVGVTACSPIVHKDKQETTKKIQGDSNSLILQPSGQEPIIHSGHAAHASHVSHYSAHR